MNGSTRLPSWLLAYHFASLGCGAATELDEGVTVVEEPEPLSEEDACSAAENAEWSGGDCAGQFDRCDLVHCRHVGGAACDCFEDDECWNGRECVER